MAVLTRNLSNAGGAGSVLWLTMLRSVGLVLALALAAGAQDTLDAPPRLKRGVPKAGRGASETSVTGLPTVEQPKAAGDTGQEREEAAAEAARQPSAEEVFLARARQAAETFTENLPNFLCQELITRYESTTRPVNWRALDTLSLDVVYEDHKEEYKNIKVNGKATTKRLDELDGAWSTGDFGTLLAALYAGAEEEDFRPAGSSRLEGREVKRYNVTVAKERSGWQLHAGEQELITGYTGTVFLDPETAQTRRLEIQSAKLPDSFGLSVAEWAVDYGYTRINGQEYLVPLRSEILSCARGSRFCSRNVIEFRNYRKFGGEATITFDQN